MERKPRILFVDDEERVLDGLRRTLRREFDVSTATSGAAGLELMKTSSFAAVVSDMRMPGMNGAQFLAAARELAPDTVRLLLTGFAELEAAVSAVNDGNIFRFLSKPCPQPLLLRSLREAVDQHDLVTGRKELLEKTLNGSIQMLVELVALLSPVAFGRASRVKSRMLALAEKLELTDTWQLEVAAALSQMGSSVLPPELVAKRYHGETLDEGEQNMVNRSLAVADDLLAHIPRLEAVREIVAYQDRRYDSPEHPRGERIPVGARMLKILLDADVLEARGLDAAQVADTLRSRRGWYDPTLLEAFLASPAPNGTTLRQLGLQELRPGYIFENDVKSSEGVILVARGQEARAQVIERLRNLAVKVGIVEPLVCRVPSG